MTGTLVIQSHRTPLPHAWLKHCLQSVSDWAAGRGFDYQMLGDELFDYLPDDIRRRTADQPVIGTDVARLYALGRNLSQGSRGYETVIWCDADLLVFDPQRLNPSTELFSLGREVWVQPAEGRLRVRVKVHNAFLTFRRGNSFLDFYRDSAERLIRAHDPDRGMAPQFVGPKLLTALHNVVGCPITESAGMLSPAVADDLLADNLNGDALTLFRRRSPDPPAALNLCASLCQDDARYEDLIELLNCRDANPFPRSVAP